MGRGSPAVKAKRLGAFWTTTIGSKKVVIFKSESHLSQDTKKLPTGNGTLPNYDVWKQIIDEVRPKLVITTGTAGGIGKEFTQAPFDRTVTQEARLSNPDGSPVTWTAGFYYYRNKNEQIFSTGPATTIFSPFVVVTEVPTQTSYAGFGELTYPITDTLRATVGLRETADHIQATDTFDVFGGRSADLFDKDYIAVGGSRTAIAVGDPRELRATFTYTF